MSARTALAALAALTALALLGPAGLASQNVAEVQVAPPSVTIKVGERSGLLATAFDRVGNVIPTVRLIWQSNNIQVAKVDNDGTVTGVSGGVAIIEARVGTRKGQAVVQVVGAPPQAGGGQPQTPPRPPTGQQPPPEALVGQPAGTGPASVLRIEPPTIYLLPSENTRVFPRALKDDGTPAAPVAVTWRSLREDIATVDPNGVVVALAAGQGTIQVTALTGLTATAPVVVQQTEIAIAEPSPLTLGPGETDTVHVVVPGQGNRTISPLSLQWASTDPTVARVTLTGIVTAVAPGRAALIVSGLLQSKRVDVVVYKAVEKLAVLPSPKSEIPVPIQSTAKFQAQALTADNVVVPEAPLRWSVSDSSIAAFDPATGVLTGRKAGRAQLMVKGPGQGLAVTWSIRVIAGSVKLATARLGLSLGKRYVMRASYTDETGTIIGPATGLTWASDNPPVAVITEDGTITAAGYGHGRITATAPGGKRAAADVFVQGEIVLASSRTGRFQLYAVERSNLAQFRKVSEDTSTAADPAFSPDGSRIAFVSLRDGQPEIYVMDADGSNVARLTNSAAVDGGPAFTADGQAVAFHSQRTGHLQVFVQQITGSDAIQLTQEPATNSDPTVSPDGETIAFVSNREGNNDIWLMSKDGTNQRAFTRTPQIKEGEPRFLRDGTLAYLVEQKEGGRTITQVVKADLVTGRVTPLTGTDLVITGFATSPGGDLLALVVNVGGGKGLSKVYVQPVGSGAPVPLPTTGAEQLTSPAFLP